MSTTAAAAEPITAEKSVPAGTYNDKVVRQFAIMTIVWGIVGMAVGVLIAAQLFWPELNFDVPWLSYGRLRPLHTNAVIFAFGGSALFATSYYVVQRTCHVRLFADDGSRRSRSGAGRPSSCSPRSRCRSGMTQGKEYAELEWPIDLLIAAGVGRIRHRVPRHAGQAPRLAHLRRQLVLRLVHHHGRRAAHRQQRRDPGIDRQVVSDLRRHRRCDGAVVVRTQCGGLFPDRGLPRHDVLLRAEAGRTACLLVPAVHRALLGAHLHLHVGRPASPALHHAAGLGAVAGHGVLADPARAVLGRHDQRPHDAVGRVAQAAHRSRSSSSWSWRCRSTACPPSKVR